MTIVPPSSNSSPSQVAKQSFDATKLLIRIKSSPEVHEYTSDFQITLQIRRFGTKVSVTCKSLDAYHIAGTVLDLRVPSEHDKLALSLAVGAEITGPCEKWHSQGKGGTHTERVASLSVGDTTVTD